MRILITDDVSELGIAKLQDLPNAQVRVQMGWSEAELIREIPQFDALLVRSQTKVTAKVIEAASNLKVIGRAGVGVDNIDLPAATKRGIVVINAPDGNTISAAEHTFAMMVTLARLIPQADASIRSGKWDRKSLVGVELLGKTLSVLGTGRIGAEVAKRAQVFGMRVVGFDPFLTDVRAAQLGIERMALDDAIAVADFITVHTPLTKETRHMLDDAAFARAKQGVRIINCARGGIVDETALCRALESGKVAGAALDVFESEPLRPDHPLLRFPNVVVTPHLGASTVEAQVNVAIDVAEQMGYVLQGQPFENAVNLPSLTAEQKHTLLPYIHLGEQLGAFAAQMVPEAPTSVDISYAGELAKHDISFLTRTILKGYFGYQYADAANYVNAPILAEESGLSVREVKQQKGKVFTNLVSLTFTTTRGVHSVAGTLYNGFGPRIVEVDGYAVDAPTDGFMVVTKHIDKPGMVGKIGTLLGNAGINIAAMQVGRRESGGEALMVLSVDKSVPDDVVQDVARVSGITFVRGVNL